MLVILKLEQTLTLQCRACPAGFTSAVGASECVICPPGRYSPVEGSGICSICVAGSFSEYSGSTDVFLVLLDSTRHMKVLLTAR